MLRLSNIRLSIRNALAIATTTLALMALVATPALACGPDAPQPAKKIDAQSPSDVAIPVEGMTCGGCANNVQVALMALDGVVDVKVSYEDGKAYVHYDAKVIAPKTMLRAIDAAGYTAGKPVKVNKPAPKRST